MTFKEWLHQFTGCDLESKLKGKDTTIKQLENTISELRLKLAEQGAQYMTTAHQNTDLQNRMNSALIELDAISTLLNAAGFPYAENTIAQRVNLLIESHQNEPLS